MLLTLLKWISIAGVAVGVIFLLWVQWTTRAFPDQEEAAVFCSSQFPRLESDQELKVLTWNIQYLAGKNYTFWYDRFDNSGPDLRPSRQDLDLTREGVLETLVREDPDVILLQEVDQGSDRTDRENQVELLVEGLRRRGKNYCHASTYYWLSAYHPHPKVRGSVGMKLLTLSKYRMTQATRHQLPRMPGNPIYQRLNLQRAILEVRLPTEDKDFIVLNTHLDAFAQGSDTMSRQVSRTVNFLERLEEEAWVLGGDFNLLPPHRIAYESLSDTEKRYFLPESEMKPFYDRFQVVPTLQQTGGSSREKWFTHWRNVSELKEADRTLDYFVLSPELEVLQSQVIADPEVRILSDHFPLVMTLRQR